MMDFLASIAQRACRAESDVRPGLPRLYGEPGGRSVAYDQAPDSAIEVELVTESPAPIGAGSGAASAWTPAVQHVPVVSPPQTTAASNDTAETSAEDRQQDVPLNGVRQARLAESPVDRIDGRRTATVAPVVTTRQPQPTMPGAPPPRISLTVESARSAADDGPRIANPPVAVRHLKGDGASDSGLVQGQTAISRAQPEMEVVEQRNVIAPVRVDRRSDTENPSVAKVHREIIPVSVARAQPAVFASAMNIPDSGQRAVQPETIVQVTIGRVEVRASAAPIRTAAARDARPRRPSQSLEDYLRGSSPGRPA